MSDDETSLALEAGVTGAMSANLRDGAEERRDPSDPTAVVGLGASAGGVAVLQQFFADMPGNSGLAFVVVMHLSPDFESQLAGVIQHKTTMPVIQVTEGVKVLPNHVYVIPPGKQLTLENGMLEVIEPQQAIGRRVTIDLFFRTLAHSYGQRAVCIIMSGTDSDGVIGLKHVRAQGGLTIAQDPKEAEHDSMPANAIKTGVVDWVLPVGRIAPKLMEFVRNENRMRLPPEIPAAGEPDAEDKDAPGGPSVSDETRREEEEYALANVLTYLRDETGHDFTHYKRATVLRRIARRMQVNMIERVPQYLEFIRTTPEEPAALLQDLLIGVTQFFRDQNSFAVLEENIPQLFAGKREADQVRVWVAGCATGEEAYSIAMLLCEHVDRLDSGPSFQVFATDIDDQSIHEARHGIYQSTIEADVSVERLHRFFAKEGNQYRVKKYLRDMVLFASHNLLTDAPFSRLDLISCRNLLIYLNSHAQEQALDIFHFALRAGGMLFVGTAESAKGAQSLFSPVDAKHRLFVRRSVPRLQQKVPGLPPRLPVRAVGTRRPVTLPVISRAAIEQTGTDTLESNVASQERRSILFAELHLKLLEHYGPPSVLVNERYDIVHLSEHAGRYLSFMPGEPSMNLLNAIYPSLRVELRTALYRADQTNENVIAADQEVEVGGKPELITLHVRPIHPEDSAHGFFLVLFEKVTERLSLEDAKARNRAVDHALDEELQSLKGQLHATVEQYEASGEELKASNEELQAMNEEMRSSAEELQTSQEELLSVNEELTTVNNELKEKVSELAQANSDLQNLMSATDVGSIFLDREMRIKLFTPRVQEVFNLLPADIGRPISDITHKLAYRGLIEDAEKVLRTLKTVETEVRVGRDNWFLTRIAPYRTADDHIAGIVATFIDISDRKRSEVKLRDVSRELATQVHRFDTIMGAVPDFVYQFDLEGKFTYVSQSLLDLWEINSEEAIGKNFHQLDYTAELASKLQGQIQEVIQTHRQLKDETPYTSAIGTRMYEYLFFPLLREDGRVEGVAGVTRDITERKLAEGALRESEERFRTVADNVPQVIWTNEPGGKADYFNRRWFEYTGLSSEESIGAGWQALVHPNDAVVSGERWDAALSAGEVFESEYRLRGADGNYRWFIGRNVPLRDTSGRITSWFGTATDIDDLKQAEAALREGEERYRLLVEGARDYAMFMLDLDNKIEYWSTGAERVFGWTAEEAVGQGGELIFTPEDRANNQEKKEMDTARREGCANDRRWHLRKDGTRIWVDGVMRRLDDEKGNVRGYAKIARDTTELRRAQVELEERVKERTRELQQAMDRRRMLEREVLDVTERERARISQDLHDSLCQELTATAFLLNSKAKEMGTKAPSAAASLKEAAKTVNDNAGLARDLAHGLHPFQFGSSGLLPALRDLAARTNDHVPCRFSGPRSLHGVDDSVAVNLYRIAQEAVNNATKHAQPSEIEIKLHRESDQLILCVGDDGKAMPKKIRPGGMGIHLMNYRANVSGGALAIESKRGHGTTVKCKVPLKN